MVYVWSVPVLQEHAIVTVSLGKDYLVGPEA